MAVASSADGTPVRLESGIPLKRISPILKGGSYLAELSSDGVTVTVRVNDYDVTVEGQQAPEMFDVLPDHRSREHISRCLVRFLRAATQTLRKTGLVSVPNLAGGSRMR